MSDVLETPDVHPVAPKKRGGGPKTPEGKAFALRVYTEARPGYHAVTRSAVDKLLGWQG